MKNIARKHHFLPKFYLNGFLSDKKRLLYIIDSQAGKQFKSKPESVAYKNNLYALDVGRGTGQNEVDGFEKALSEFEGKIPPVIRSLSEKQELPTEDELIALLNFVALMHSRVPSSIDNSAEPLQEIIKMSLKMMTSSEERFKTVIRSAEGAGIDISSLDYEGYKDFVEREEYIVEINQNFKLKTLLDKIDILTPLLLDRSWSLLIADDLNGGFICSDNPVSLVSTVELPPFWGPGFGMKNTEVTMPLTKNMALIGRFEEKSRVLSVPKTILAAINSRTCMYSNRLIISAQRHFIYTAPSGKIAFSSDLICDINNQ